ncbi:MAG: hypothetical protein NC114_06395 [Ruminococcus flavefaciens]|nr:hypothetical protein [Ruminococcus flavefaciens]
MNTLMLLETVKKYVLKNLTAADVEHVETDDLEQEIYMITLELLQSSIEADSVDALCATVLQKIRTKLGVQSDDTALRFGEIGIVGCPISYCRRMNEQIRARETVEDLLETVLDPTEEVVVRLYYGVPTAEMCEEMHIKPTTHYSVMDIIYLLRWHDSRETRRRVNDTLTAAMQKLRPNARAFMLLH